MPRPAGPREVSMSEWSDQAVYSRLSHIQSAPRRGAFGFLFHRQLDRRGLVDRERDVPEFGAVAQGLGRITIADVAAVVALHGIRHVPRVAMLLQVIQRPVGRTYQVLGAGDGDVVQAVVDLEI